MRRVAVVVLLVAAACTKPGERIGSGVDVGLCDAVSELAEVAEPAPGDADAQARWADATARILGRIDPAQRQLRSDDPSAGRQPLDDDAVAALDAAIDAIDGFRAEIGEPGALQTLADGPWGPSADALTTLARERCE